VSCRHLGSPPDFRKVPQMGVSLRGDTTEPLGGGGNVKLLKRFAVAMGSLLALAIAGGAHVRW
jgi:hypothetical protein